MAVIREFAGLHTLKSSSHRTTFSGKIMPCQHTCQVPNRIYFHFIFFFSINLCFIITYWYWHNWIPLIPICLQSFQESEGLASLLTWSLPYHNLLVYDLSYHFPMLLEVAHLQLCPRLAKQLHCMSQAGHYCIFCRSNALTSTPCFISRVMKVTRQEWLESMQKGSNHKQGHHLCISTRLPITADSVNLLMLHHCNVLFAQYRATLMEDANVFRDESFYNVCAQQRHQGDEVSVYLVSFMQPFNWLYIIFIVMHQYYFVSMHLGSFISLYYKEDFRNLLEDHNSDYQHTVLYRT